MSSSLVSNYESIYKRLSERELDGDSFYGFLSVDENIQRTLIKLKEEGLTTGAYEVYKDGTHVSEVDVDRTDSIPKASDIKIKVDLSSKRIGPDYIICKDWDELLSYEEKIEQPVNSIFFYGSGIFLSDEKSDKKFESYKSIGKIYALIKELADTTSGRSTTIFYGRALFFEFGLTEADIDNPVDIEAISTLLEKGIHKEAITNLICSELVSFLKDKDSKVRFSYLVRHSSSFVSNVLLSYQSYVANYNFEKVRKEYLEKKTEYIQKIYSVFDDIAIKMLSIPAGIWFATNQIETASYGEISLYKNAVVLVTVICLVLILVLHMLGQFSVLKTIKKEYAELFDCLSKKFEDESSKIIGVKEDLESAKFKVEIKIWFSIFAAIVMLIMTVVLFCVSFN